LKFLSLTELKNMGVTSSRLWWFRGKIPCDVFAGCSEFVQWGRIRNWEIDKSWR
jgi:hypothetical protein